MVSGLVDAFTKALPMRSLFYHQILFTIIITKLPLLEYDTCDYVVEALGCGIIALCSIVCFLYSLFVEKLPWYWSIASLLMYWFIGYVTTPDFFSCFGVIYDKDVHQWFVVVLFVILGVAKALIFIDKKAIAGLKGGRYDRERRDLHLLDEDVGTINSSLK